MTLSSNALALGGRLHGVSFALERGGITAICGPNGAGKSSLLQVLAGLIDADAGEVTLEAEPLSTMRPRHRAQRIGYLPQTPEIAWDVPVRSLVELGRLPHGDARAGPVDAALDALDLRALELRRAQTLSGGETARVLLARVLAGEPDWILADEPLAALDLSHQLALVRHLRRAADQGAGVVLVLHDLAMAMNHADRVLVLDHGRLAADGSAVEALSPARIAEVWGVATQWIGDAGARALIVS